MGAVRMKKIVWDDAAFNAFATSDEIDSIVQKEAEKASRKLDSSLQEIRSIQRSHDSSRKSKRQLSSLTTEVSSDIDTYKGKSRAVALIYINGLTVMDIMRQTVQRAIFMAIPAAKIITERRIGVRKR